MILQYIIIVGIILLISWTIRYMIQRDMKTRQQNHTENQEKWGFYLIPGKGRERKCWTQ